MAAQNSYYVLSLFGIVFALFLSIPSSDCQLQNDPMVIPVNFHGEWYAYINGISHTTLIGASDIQMTQKLTGPQEKRKVLYKGKMISQEMTLTDNGLNVNSKILFYDAAQMKYFCFWFLHRTINVLQVRKSSSPMTNNDPNNAFASICGTLSPEIELETFFRKAIRKVDCKTTFDGVYHFDYKQKNAGGGICSSDKSGIYSCHAPGSPYVDNEIFFMRFGRCPNIASDSSSDVTLSGENIRFQCLGSWSDQETGNIFSAVAMNKDRPEDKFRCLLTNLDQQRLDLKKRYVMSVKPTCLQLRGAAQGPVELILSPTNNQDQLDEISPACNLPSNFTGDWFTTSEYDSNVVINSTHIFFKTKLDQYRYRESYFTCQQTRDSRYLMTAVTVGRCEIDYICVDFLPRHHNIIRYRMGKPYRQTKGELGVKNYRSLKFLEACSWSSFNFKADNWKYKTLILDPPNPIVCPVAGIYRFIQTGLQSEKYHTRIRGVTERPRMQVDCREFETQLRVCRQDTKKILVDAQRCATVDHLGRPIGEYDEPDHELLCVGYWMEDSRSYLITHDEEDATSRFRCWTYQRLDYQNILMSRATSSACGQDQTPRSYSSKEGASLALELLENEREFDDCPQYFNDGRLAYKDGGVYTVIGSSAVFSRSNIVVIITMIILAAIM